VRNEVPDKEPMPTTAIGIWLRLRELAMQGSGVSGPA
jgi:hypothetical protein